MQPATSDSGFVPRKEFIRDQRTRSDFALLAISGSSFIRLYSFSPDVIVDLRRLFNHFFLNAASREDSSQNLFEFQLHGKPWASPKSERTERILLDILVVIYKHGYTILSTINYGRERDDRLAISFSRLSTSLIVPPHSPIPAGSGSNLSHTTPRNERKMLFAISFVSSTVVRVIYPPLNSTPAILQAVRGSWPRGVVSERKVSEAAFEFKLKGYSWFNEDTFATDSLQQILSILSSLDEHACSMITSLSFNSHSRVKDLWVFTGPGSADSYEQYWPDSPVSQSGSMLDVRRSNRASTPDQALNPDPGIIPSSLHRRAATVSQHPAHVYPHSQSTAMSHNRAATETNITLPPYSPTLPLGSPRAAPGNGIRKPAPRAQVPVSVDLDAHDEDEHLRYRTSLASVVPSSCENMTGIGTLHRNRLNPNTSPADISGTTKISDDDDETIHLHQETSPSGAPPHRMANALRPQSTRSKTPPLFTSHARDPRASTSDTEGMSQVQDHVVTGENAPLLSPGMFRIRDSAFSANSVGTSGSCEVPIKWSGLSRPEGIGDIEEEPDQYYEDSGSRHVSPPPTLPGAWGMTSDQEQPTSDGEVFHPHKPTVRQRRRSPDRSVHDVDARVASPEVIREDAVRKSETGLVGVISAQPPQPVPSPISMPSKESLGRTKRGSGGPPASPTKTGSRSGSTDRWVLVNLEGKDHMGHMPSPLASPTIPQAADRSRKPSANVVSQVRGSSPAKAAVVSATDGKSARDKGSGLRRLLSLSLSGKGAELNDDAQFTANRPQDSTSNSPRKGPVRSGRFRNKLSRFGTAETPTKPPDRVRVKLD
ncbi:hypothetical protein BKA82DRAFT_147892 [Pisolithus tinctorius]|uniref:Uncharacterized protein n=1 Tax=Pisolithus tinctorius Marx 270 TaxID=870435 RepID=A0A0C3JXW2_PISTI|nr:hypothetical protein BKA82DRAFT_147892 [Pisolithus tinctorius]KIO02247.1 hypothetical protein M404DRAFT_147892 [Pisolithus tinctorius Marx 270]